MENNKVNLKNEKAFQEAILQEKARGISDLEIGQKYGVSFKYIERLITRSQGVNISNLKVSKKIKAFSPKDFKEELTTVWSFKQRGNWATHSGEYRGNWSPYIPRNVILKYSKPDELVLDYFCGAGTTAVECKLLGRKCIAFDINDRAVELARENLDFDIKSRQLDFFGEQINRIVYEPELFVGNARDLSFLSENSVDLICAHPPYANIIHYTNAKEGDLSFYDIDDFLREMTRVARESYRVLKPGRQCAILIGDTRRKKYVISLGFNLINVYLKAGFKLRELIIKRQHNCKTTGFWYANSIKFNFLLLAHEYLPIFEKPESPVDLSVKERAVDYSSVLPAVDKLSLKRKIDELQTTTVWILPEKDFEKHLNKNVIDRYANRKKYSTIYFISQFKKETHSIGMKDRGKDELLFIKSPFLENSPSCSDIENYLKEIKDIANLELSHINKGGFFIVQTEDIRINGYVEPIAKKIVDFIKNDNLLLKEIVIVTQEKQEPEIQTSNGYLKINHQYLLVYEVMR